LLACPEKVGANNVVIVAVSMEVVVEDTVLLLYPVLNRFGSVKMWLGRTTGIPEDMTALF
jgi:hypothetical protein